MSGKDVPIIEIGDLWVIREDVIRVAKELGVGINDVVTDPKLSAQIDLVLLQHFFDNKGAILKEVVYGNVTYVYGKVSITYSGIPFKTYKRLFFRSR